MTGWQPIETVPRSESDLDLIYGDDPLRANTVIVGRPDEAVSNGVIPGVVCEAAWIDGSWKRPTHPDWRHAFGDWITVADPTHWMPLPLPPETTK